MKYFFLLSWLPEPTREQAGPGVTLADLAEERFHIDRADWAEIERILIRGDLMALERLIEGKAVGGQFTLHDAAFWREELRSPAEAPHYIVEVLEKIAPGAPAPVSIDALYNAYFMDVLASSRNEFLQNYVRLELDLRNFQAGRRARRLGRDPGEAMVREGAVAEAAAASQAEDFGLSRELPWVETILAAQGAAEMEAAEEGVLWNFLEERMGPDPFTFECLLAYIFKLQILEKRLSRSPEKGMAMIRNWGGN